MTEEAKLAVEDLFLTQGVHFSYKDMLTHTFDIGLKSFTFAGYNPRAQRYPFIMEEVATGKKYKIPTESIRIALNMEDAD